MDSTESAEALTPERALSAPRSASAALPQPALWVRHRTLLAVICFGLFVFAVYLWNGRGAAGGDVDPSTYLPIAILRGHGPFLDHLPQAGGHGVATSRGHRVSRYPLAPAILAVPFTAPVLWFLDVTRPEWQERYPQYFAVFMAKTAHSALVAILAALLLLLCRQLGAPWPVAVTAALGGALGSTLWSVASQGAWQHGATALGFGATLCLLSVERPGATHLCFAGLSAAVMTASRTLNLVFALAVAAYVAWTYRRAAWPFFIFPLLVGSALALWNFTYFGTLSGGQAELEALHPKFHGVTGTWTGNLVDGALGTLLSPNRGLLVFTPWTLVALALLPVAGWRTLPPLLRWLLPALGVYALLLSKYSCWWAGWSFGPRFWTDTLPLFVALFSVGLTSVWQRSRAALALAALTVALAIGIHFLGAFGYPSTWNAQPRNVDLAHERLWDWRDTELRRIWAEMPLQRIRQRSLWDWPRRPHG